MRPFAGLYNFRGLAIRYKYHLEDYLRMQKLGYLNVLPRHFLKAY